MQGAVKDFLKPDVPAPSTDDAQISLSQAVKAPISHLPNCLSSPLLLFSLLASWFKNFDPGLPAHQILQFSVVKCVLIFVKIANFL